MESKAFKVGPASFPMMPRRWPATVLANPSTVLPLRAALLSPVLGQARGLPFLGATAIRSGSRGTHSHKIHCQSPQESNLSAPDDSAKLAFALDPILQCLRKLPSRHSLKGALYLLLLSLGMAVNCFLMSLGGLRKEITEKTLSGGGYTSVIFPIVGIIAKSVYESLKQSKEVGEVLAFFWVVMLRRREKRKRLTAEVRMCK